MNKSRGSTPFCSLNVFFSILSLLFDIHGYVFFCVCVCCCCFGKTKCWVFAQKQTKTNKNKEYQQTAPFLLNLCPESCPRTRVPACLLPPSLPPSLVHLHHSSQNTKRIGSLHGLYPFLRSRKEWKNEADQAVVYFSFFERCKLSGWQVWRAEPKKREMDNPCSRWRDKMSEWSGDWTQYTLGRSLFSFFSMQSIDLCSLPLKVQSTND